MRVLAIDPGVHCGFAYRDGDRRVESGTQTFDLRRGESPGWRFMRFNEWLRHGFVWASGRPQLIIYEQAHLRGGATTDLLVGMTTRLEEWAAEIGAEHKAVHSGTLKKAVAGHGKASKEEMMAAVGGADEHEADARALLRFYDLGMPEGAGRKKRGKP